MLKKVLCTGLIIFLCLCSSFVTIVISEKVLFQGSYKNGYIAGQIDLTKAIANEGATINGSQIDESCKNFINIKETSMYVCTKNGHKIIAVYE